MSAADLLRLNGEPLQQLSRNLTAMEPSSLVLVGAGAVVILVALVVAGRVSRLGADNLAEQIGRAAGRGARGDDADLSAVAEGRNSARGSGSTAAVFRSWTRRDARRAGRRHQSPRNDDR